MRHQILSYFNTNDEQYKLIFTAGATSACKLIAHCFSWDEGKSQFVYLDESHTSVVGIRELAPNFNAVAEEDVVSNLFGSNRSSSHSAANNLFAFPAMSNFCGKKFPCKEWINLARKNNGKWYILLDAAAYVSTNKLNLQELQPDFVCISFYKIFGYPTGLGALLVKFSALPTLKKKYFGGGTVDMNLIRQPVHAAKSSSIEGR